MTPTLKKLSAILTWGFFFCLLLLRVLWALLGEKLGILVLARFAPAAAYLAVLLAIFVVDASLRRGKSLLPGGLSFLFILVILMPPSLGLQADTGAPEFKVVSFNIRAGLAGEKKIGSYLRQLEADVYCLQEARASLANPDHDPVPELKKELPGYSMVRGGTRGELVTFSRFPVLSQKIRKLDSRSRMTDTIVETDRGELRILNVHFIVGSPGGLSLSGLEASARQRHDQARAIAKVVRESKTPTILLGDFNTPPGSTAYQILADQFQDSFAKAGFGMGWTFPTRLPVWRIDFIWVRKLLVHTTHTGPRGLSDHRPVIARLSYP